MSYTRFNYNSSTSAYVEGGSLSSVEAESSGGQVVQQLKVKSQGEVNEVIESDDEVDDLDDEEQEEEIVAQSQVVYKTGKAAARDMFKEAKQRKQQRQMRSVEEDDFPNTTSYAMHTSAPQSRQLTAIAARCAYGDEGQQDIFSRYQGRSTADIVRKFQEKKAEQQLVRNSDSNSSVITSQHLPQPPSMVSSNQRTTTQSLGTVNSSGMTSANSRERIPSSTNAAQQKFFGRGRRTEKNSDPKCKEFRY